MFILPVLWAVNFLVARSAMGFIEPHILALLRWLIAGLLFTIGSVSELRIHRRHIVQDWKRYLLLGALGMWICGAWVYIGGRTTEATNIALIYSTSPVMIVVLSAIWLKERFNVLQACGVAFSLAGVVHVILKGQWGALASVHFVPGDGWILAATASWTTYCLLLKRWSSPLSSSARLAVISFAGVLVLIPFALLEFLYSSLPALTLKGFGLALATALLPGYGAYLAYIWMQNELGAARVSVALYLGPVYAAILAWLVLAEPMQIYHAWGMALILPGIYLVTRPH